MPGKLIIVPTPIGNLGDMPARALEALQACDVVCAEDTRVTGKLLAAFGIEKRLERLDENIIGQRAQSIVNRVLAGEVVAYCTDAGMPGVSDPGLRLVRVARDADAPIEVLPGPSAAVTAYVASGCADTAFYFGGFLPRKDAARSESLEQLRNLQAALIFYESPKRLVGSLRVIAQVFPHRSLSVCRELTKLHEEVVCGSVSDVLAQFEQREQTTGIKGEIVIVIEGPNPEERKAHSFDAFAAAKVRAEQLVSAGERPKQIARILADEFGIARNDAYELALAAKGQ